MTRCVAELRRHAGASVLSVSLGTEGSAPGMVTIMHKHPPIEDLLLAGPKVALPDYPRDRRTISFHEAGHAVLSSILHVPMLGARVHDEPQSNGIAGKVDLDLAAIQATAAATADTAIPQTMLERVTVELTTMYVSGAMAETMLHGIEIKGWLDLDWRDFRNARVLLREAFGTESPLYYCQRLASAVLSENWPWVAAVAGKIEAHGWVTRAEIAYLRRVSRETSA